MQHVMVPLADGFEEIEAITVIDILRRAGVRVTVAGIEATSATGSHAIRVECDAVFAVRACEDADALVLPGGMPGSRHLRESPLVREAVTAMAASGRLIGAICAAPTVLESCGVLRGIRATSHPDHAHEMKDCLYEEAAVVEDGNFITSRGAGMSIDFAAALVRRLADEDAARDILARIQYRRS